MRWQGKGRGGGREGVGFGFAQCAVVQSADVAQLLLVQQLQHAFRAMFPKAGVATIALK